MSLPPIFINKQKHNHSFLPSLWDLQRGLEDEIWVEIPRDIEVDITMAHTMKRILEEDPDADIDELDFFSDED